ncbi:Serine/threonine-protein kinase chk1 [Colletotrichum spinosum]|uniref:non-specific serine/threonine protein kinase n=1 Tax=Colletotrichum spinosum TaxID=1347390 RepID=A0A4R8PMB6_9PEZI|nr:Serine/threonine-protein kinase chk1 [Colletotrichum spinosum]
MAFTIKNRCCPWGGCAHDAHVAYDKQKRGSDQAESVFSSSTQDIASDVADIFDMTSVTTNTPRAESVMEASSEQKLTAAKVGRTGQTNYVVDQVATLEKERIGISSPPKPLSSTVKITGNQLLKCPNHGRPLVRWYGVRSGNLQCKFCRKRLTAYLFECGVCGVRACYACRMKNGWHDIRGNIKKAIPQDTTTPVFAVKFIHKGYATKHGRVSAKQLLMEVSLHSHVGQHPNIIEWFASGEDINWRWIAMEFADGGDLFDKIEADVGVNENIAHVYFLQLISGVSFIHSKGVAHRDLKPENILLSETGNLKLADFGMATMFEYKGRRKTSSTLCGSPPYIAPEILACSKGDKPAANAGKYSPDLVDIWSCGVILFVLLVGNTPWDEPSNGSWEYQEYVRTNGRSTDALWAKVPSDALSLLRGMININPGKRFSFARIRQHPWYTRHNPHLTSDGQVSDPINLATKMLESLRIDFSQHPTASQGTPSSSDTMDIDPGQVSFTQPETPINDVSWDWERPALKAMNPMAVSSTQPLNRSASGVANRRLFLESLADEPSMSQFSQTPGVPLTLTQAARRFRDIVPFESLTRFFSHVPPQLIVQMLSDALHQLNVPLPPVAPNLYSDHIAMLKIRTLDERRQSLHGEIHVYKHRLPDEQELLDIRFVKIKGDPLEWRRFFKKVVVLCKDGVYVPEA